LIALTEQKFLKKSALAKPAARPKARNQINWHLRRGRKQEISLKQACAPAECKKKF